MSKKILCAILSLSLAVSFCFAQQEENVASVEGASSAEKEYIISSNDILEITVYQEPDMSATVRVNEDETINYPLLGNIRAAGLTIRQLEKIIADLLSEDYLVSIPQVSIFVKEFSRKTVSLSIFILGQVKSPGAREVKPDATLTQAIAFAGGFTDTANTNKVKIIRTTKDKKETIMVDAERILEKVLPDVELRQNDTIIIEEYGRISIMGQVTRPGVYGLKKGLRVIEAISLAGGFTPTASQNSTRVLREQDGKKITIRVPVASIMQSGDVSKDIELQNGDTIVVPESFF